MPGKFCVSITNSHKDPDKVTVGFVVANAAIVPAGTNGSIDVYVSDRTDVLFDINGYFAPPTSAGLQFFAVNPCRVADTGQSPEARDGGVLVRNIVQRGKRRVETVQQVVEKDVGQGPMKGRTKGRIEAKVQIDHPGQR